MELIVGALVLMLLARGKSAEHDSHGAGAPAATPEHTPGPDVAGAVGAAGGLVTAIAGAVGGHGAVGGAAATGGGAAAATGGTATGTAAPSSALAAEAVFAGSAGGVSLGAVATAAWVIVFFVQFIVIMLVSRGQQEQKSFEDAIRRLDNVPFRELHLYETAMVIAALQRSRIGFSESQVADDRLDVVYRSSQIVGRGYRTVISNVALPPDVWRAVQLYARLQARTYLLKKAELGARLIRNGLHQLSFAERQPDGSYLTKPMPFPSYTSTVIDQLWSEVPLPDGSLCGPQTVETRRTAFGAAPTVVHGEETVPEQTRIFSALGSWGEVSRRNRLAAYVDAIRVVKHDAQATSDWPGYALTLYTMLELNPAADGISLVGDTRLRFDAAAWGADGFVNVQAIRGGYNPFGGPLFEVRA